MYNTYFLIPGKKRPNCFGFKTKFKLTLALICFDRLALALKWLIPALRALILPFFVILSLLEKDLFVFMLIKIDCVIIS